MLPKTPVFDWSNLGAAHESGESLTANSIEAVAHQVMTTSGRAALYQALLGLKVEPGRGVLVPTYHCPTMVAPIVRAGLQPMFYGVRADGTPDLEGIAIGTALRPAAMVVAHFFGLPLSLETTRAWCDENHVILIEDCAHCFFGQAGARTVGQWGDYAFASLTKFFPVPEAGLLVSHRHPLALPKLDAPTGRAQLKGCVDVLELASRYGRPRGGAALLRAVCAAKNRTREIGGQREDASRPAEHHGGKTGLAIDCDMERVNQSPLWVSRWLFREVARTRIFTRRRENYIAYAKALNQLPGARALQPILPDGAAPYVFALLVEDADRVYHALRQQGMPVNRWDRVWPQTPVLPRDYAPLWRQNVLQLLCHQDLSVSDVGTVCQALAQLLSTAGASATLTANGSNR